MKFPLFSLWMNYTTAKLQALLILSPPTMVKHNWIATIYLNFREFKDFNYKYKGKSIIIVTKGVNGQSSIGGSINCGLILCWLSLGAAGGPGEVYKDPCLDLEEDRNSYQ